MPVRPQLLRAIQHRTARVAIGSSAMRGAGSRGVIQAARTFLGDLSLRRFGTTSASRFRSQLDKVTTELVAELPKGARHWGLARKGLNIFLRDCLYTTYLREKYRLDRAEAFYEIPLDSITARELRRESKERLPRWRGVRNVNAAASDRYQEAAAIVATRRKCDRVHLDAIWWGERPEE